MNLLLCVVAIGVALSAVMAIAWWIILKTGESGRADAIWTFGTGIAAAAAALSSPNAPSWTARQSLIAILMLGWALRLGIHIARRSGGRDDPRYADLKARWGRNLQSRMFLFLQIQAAAAFVLAVSVMAAAQSPAPLGWQDGLALLIALGAIGGEAVADRQLAAFRAAPAHAGQICDVGLWSRSRHPNYFFEWLFWVAVPVFALNGLGFSGWGWISLAAPLLMYALLVHVSGIPPLEAHMLRSRGAAFVDYQRRVNAFWPGPARPAHAAPLSRTQ